MDYLAEGSPTTVIDNAQCSQLLDRLIARLREAGPLRRVLIVPPDITRLHSLAGELTTLLYQKLHPNTHVDVLPALGTHRPMTDEEIAEMFPGVPRDRFFEHNWRTEIEQIGTVPSEFVQQVSEGKLDYSIGVYVNRMLVEGKYDRIISVGQLVPHEVIGIANHNKNIFIGVGGADLISKSHYIGAVYGMERLMGRAESPVRAVFDYASEHFAKHLPIMYLLTVRANDANGKLVTRGLYAGDDANCFKVGAALARTVNLDRVDHAPKKVVVYLDPKEFRSTWLGNKAVYRTRMAIADDGELIILAPGVCEFGERPDIDAMIRKYGYRGTPTTLAAVRDNEDLAGNLAAASHLIHGSSEGRFTITYCPGKLTRAEIESVNYRYGDLNEMLKKYDIHKLRDGWNTVAGEEVFYVSNPALGLWGTRERMGEA